MSAFDCENCVNGTKRGNVIYCTNESVRYISFDEDDDTCSDFKKKGCEENKIS